MSVRGEAAQALTGSWMLARRQTAGLALFNATPQGFWRSFWACALALPLDLGLQALVGGFSGPAGLGWPLALFSAAQVVDALAFPLLMAAISAEMGRADRWVLFVVAYNWSGLLRVALFVPAVLLTLAVPALHPVLAGVIVLLLVYQAYVAHVALKVSPFAAGGIVLLDVLVDMVVGRLAVLMLNM